MKKLLNTLTEVMQNFEERRFMCKHNNLFDVFFYKWFVMMKLGNLQVCFGLND